MCYSHVPRPYGGGLFCQTSHRKRNGYANFYRNLGENVLCFTKCNIIQVFGVMATLESDWVRIYWSKCLYFKYYISYLIIGLNFLKFKPVLNKIIINLKKNIAYKTNNHVTTKPKLRKSSTKFIYTKIYHRM